MQDIEPGDWVCFMSLGHIVYGKVEYVKKTVLGSFDIYTTVGCASDKYILEVRKQS